VSDRACRGLVICSGARLVEPAASAIALSAIDLELRRLPDRIVFVDVVSRSAFGVPARHRIAYELGPNKSNVLVLRPSGEERWQILAAAKEIQGAEGSRSIDVGEPYEPPPPRRSRLDRAAFDAMVRDCSRSGR